MTQPAAIYRIDDLTVDFVRREVFRRNGKSISLPTLSFDTLQALVEAAPAPLTADELIQRAWRGSVVSDEAVTQRIRLLRRALRDNTRQPRYIETIRGAGYRLIPRVVPAAHRDQPRFRPWVAAAVGFLALAIGVGSWLVTSADKREPAALPAPTIPQGPVTAAELSDTAMSLVMQRNPASLAHAIALYEQALAVEPGDPELLAALSLALAKSVAWYGDGIEVAQRAERLARQALRNSEFFDAEMALGFSLDAQGKMNPAQAAYERAVALDPDHYGARASLAYLLQVKGRLVEALSHNIMAMDHAPAGILDVQVASCLRLLGFHTLASEWLERSDRLDPDSAHAAPSRALDLLARREFGQARIVIDRALARGVEQIELFEYKIVLALLREDVTVARAVIRSVPESIRDRHPIESWRRIIDATADGAHAASMERSETILARVAAGDTWPDNFLYVAMLEAAAGRDDKAIVALRRLEAAGYRDFLWLELLPPLSRLHAEPEFLRIVDGMRDDIDRQRAQVLTAAWLPPELRETEPGQITPVSREE